MNIPLNEPTSPRYIYINPVTNRVHLMLPVVSGKTIGLDNTCKSVFSSQAFFGKSSNSKQITALNELIRYKQALASDLSLLTVDSPLKQPKEERLQQINDYIAAIEELQNNSELNTLNGEFPAYPVPLKTVMQEEQSNLYSMHLRPEVQDVNLRSTNPVFSLNRKNNENGNPNSILYQTLHDTYKTLTIVPQDARAHLITTVLASTAAKDNNFEEIQQVLRQKTKEQLDVDIDFTKTNTGQPVTKKYINSWMGFDNTTPPTEYIEALFGYCAPRLFDTVTQSPFYTVKTAEALSIVTQFFLGSVNIYCASHGISTANFGRILDNSSDLSQELVASVMSVQQYGLSIEDALLSYVNEHQAEFQLTKSLTSEDMNAIKTTFTDNYAQIKNSPHFDEFSVLETNKPGLFVTHQGSICTDFAELAKSPSLGINSTYFQTIRDDYHVINQTGTIPHKNAHIEESTNVDLEALNKTQLKDLLKKLPLKNQLQILKTMPALQVSMQLPDIQNHVARGEQAEAKLLLQNSPEVAQIFLLTTGPFTDYSGRTFNCTAYEYAYWGKDTHMCRMLEQHMDENTKASMLEKVIAIDTIGLTYKQHGEEIKNSKHFDMTPLITALQNYVNGYDAWDAAYDHNATAAVNFINSIAPMKEAWGLVGLAQRDLPVHVINEYCRPDRNFYPLPEFKENNLPRVSTYYNFFTEMNMPLYPFVVATNELGDGFALMRGGESEFQEKCSAGFMTCLGSEAENDLAAVIYLDEVRTADRARSRENLSPVEPEHALAMIP